MAAAVTVRAAAVGLAVACCVGRVTGVCEDQAGILPGPLDPGARGPYPVTSRLLANKLTKRKLQVEVFYPAAPGSQVGATPYTLNIRSLLTEPINRKIPDAAIPVTVYNGTYVGLPLAPQVAGDLFPVIIFVHGTAGWRGQSLNLVSHWVSRGYVVVAADYPGICLHDLLLESELHKVPRVDQVGDTRLLAAELDTLADPELQFLRGRVNMSRRALIGHSAGALALMHLSDLGAVMIPMAGDGSVAHPQLVSTLIMGAQNDSEVPARSHQLPAYPRTPPAKRLVIGANMGHQAFSDLCWIAESEGGICGIGKKYGVLAAYLFEPLAVNGCSFHDSHFFEPSKNWAMIRFATAGVLDETLRCDHRMARQLATIKERFDYVETYKQDLKSAGIDA